MKVGFIGFGGAGYGLTKGLKQAGLDDIYFFDSFRGTPPHGNVIRRNAVETGAVFKESIDLLIHEAEIVISCVTGSVALSVAGQAASCLKQRHLFVDVNTASPGTMEAVWGVIQKTGAAFADVAIMGAIPAFLNRVPCLASGNGAERFKTAMQPYGMDITCVGESPGQASAIKMFRSIFMKGLVALLLETLTATHRYHVDRTVLESITASMEKQPFMETVRLQVAKGVVNAERMTHEMEAVIQTLNEMDVSALMSTATKEKLKWCSGLNMKERFGGEMPQSLEEVLDIIAADTTYS